MDATVGNAISQLLRLLKDDDENVRIAVAVIIEKLAERSVFFFVQQFLSLELLMDICISSQTVHRDWECDSAVP